jgi:Flp pilus assembly protein TadG
MVRDPGPRPTLEIRARVRSQRAQGLVEFALVLPVILALLFGILEGSLLMFVVGSARYAAGEAAQTAAQLGNSTTADAMVVQTVRDGPLGRTALASITHIDIQRMLQQANGTLLPDGTAFNSYKLDGTAISLSWPASGRNVTSGQSDFLGVTIYYQYSWFTGALLSNAPTQLNQSFDVRLEPQTY